MLFGTVSASFFILTGSGGKRIIAKMMRRFLLIAFLLSSSISAWAKEENRVVVTIPPQAEFVERVGGERVKVSVMVPPGASPHTYEPTPRQLMEVSRAKIYVMIGSGVEFEIAWMDKIRRLNRKMLIVDSSKGVKIIDKDPHIWLSPRNAEVMVENIYEGLLKVDPAHKEYYRANKERYISQLHALHQEIARSLKGKRRRRFMVFHPSWRYFAEEYGLEQIPIEREGKEPTPREMLALIQQAKREGIKVIFASPEFNVKGAEAIAKEIGGKVLLISPLERNYLDNMRRLLQALQEALK